MRDIARSIIAPVVVAVGLMLSSCVGAAVETSLVPHDRSAALADLATMPASTPLFYAQGTASLSTTSNMDQALPGLAITLPAATTNGHHALVTFSASVTYPQSPAACNFTIYVASKKTSATGPTYARCEMCGHFFLLLRRRFHGSLMTAASALGSTG